MHFRALALDVVQNAHVGPEVLAFVGPYDWGYAIAYRWGEPRLHFLDFVDIDFI